MNPVEELFSNLSVEYAIQKAVVEILEVMHISLDAAYIKFKKVMQEARICIMRSNLCKLISSAHDVQAGIVGKALEAVFAQNKFMCDGGRKRTVRRITNFKLHSNASW